MARQYYAYMMANSIGTLYAGMTNNIHRRVLEHKNKIADGFTRQHDITKLVWYYAFNTPREAIRMEKRIKGWNRCKKVALIKTANACWMDLSKNWFALPVAKEISDSSLRSE